MDGLTGLAAQAATPKNIVFYHSTNIDTSEIAAEIDGAQNDERLL
ncbi:hypothetical protein [Vibrio furnissii]|nr:hypothetical protein [Vibrio furnissii]